jgi:hypothetical protein
MGILILFLTVRVVFGVPEDQDPPAILFFAPEVQIATSALLTILLARLLASLTDQHRQATARRHAQIAIRSALIYLLVFFGGMIVVGIAISFLDAFTSDHPAGFAAYAHSHTLIGLVTILPALLALLWWTPFAFWSSILMSFHGFRSADAHPFLPPLVTTGSAWVMAFWSLIVGDIVTHNANLPPIVDLTLGFGGAVTVSIIAIFELRTLQKRGAGFRSGPVLK